MLMTFEEFRRLASRLPSIVQLLAGPSGIENIEFEIPVLADVAGPARFD